MSLRRAKLGDTCRKGHELKTEADLYRWGTKEGSDEKLWSECRQCKRDGDKGNWHKRWGLRADKSKYVGSAYMSGARYYVQIECSHETVYVAPLPPVGELAYCLSCRDYKKVLGWLDAVAKRDRFGGGASLSDV